MSTRLLHDPESSDDSFGLRTGEPMKNKTHKPSLSAPPSPWNSAVLGSLIFGFVWYLSSLFFGVFSDRPYSLDPRTLVSSGLYFYFGLASALFIILLLVKLLSVPKTEVGPFYRNLAVHGLAILLQASILYGSILMQQALHQLD